jgi:PHD/YefM family antitoxin component YafN of YafNO toxin-antitoxin module
MMITVGAATFVRKFGQYQSIALREPVSITSSGHERLVMLSANEYKRLKRRDRQVLAREDFAPDLVAAIAKSEAPAEAAKFDLEVK